MSLSQPPKLTRILLYFLIPSPYLISPIISKIPFCIEFAWIRIQTAQPIQCIWLLRLFDLFSALRVSLLFLSSIFCLSLSLCLCALRFFEEWNQFPREQPTFWFWLVSSSPCHLTCSVLFCVPLFTYCTPRDCFDSNPVFCTWCCTFPSSSHHQLHN